MKFKIGDIFSGFRYPNQYFIVVGFSEQKNSYFFSPIFDEIEAIYISYNYDIDDNSMLVTDIFRNE